MVSAEMISLIFFPGKQNQIKTKNTGENEISSQRCDSYQRTFQTFDLKPARSSLCIDFFFNITFPPAQNVTWVPKLFPSTTPQQQPALVCGTCTPGARSYSCVLLAPLLPSSGLEPDPNFIPLVGLPEPILLPPVATAQCFPSSQQCQQKHYLRCQGSP